MLIRFRFPLDFNPDQSLSHEEVNHQSAMLHKKDIRHYLDEECEFSAIKGPFDQPPFPNMFISTFMTRPKPASEHRRVIIDLSYPQGQSVNAGVSRDTYLDTPFLLTPPPPPLTFLLTKSRNWAKVPLLLK